MSHQSRRKFLIQSMAAMATFGFRRRASAAKSSASVSTKSPRPPRIPIVAGPFINIYKPQPVSSPCRPSKLGRRTGRLLTYKARAIQTGGRTITPSSRTTRVAGIALASRALGLPATTAILARGCVSMPWRQRGRLPKRSASSRGATYRRSMWATAGGRRWL